jgi:TRAP-type C4-dicarboxylate transport system permease large subunit
LETGVDNMLCNGFVPVAFLVILRFILNRITFKKNTNMEQVNNRNNKVRTNIKNGIKSTIETVWAIGTSIAGAIALKFK